MPGGRMGASSRVRLNGLAARLRATPRMGGWPCCCTWTPVPPCCCGARALVMVRLGTARAREVIFDRFRSSMAEDVFRQVLDIALMMVECMLMVLAARRHSMALM